MNKTIKKIINITHHISSNKAQKILKERAILVDELSAYLTKRYGLKDIYYNSIWNKDQQLVKNYNKFGSMILNLN